MVTGRISFFSPGVLADLVLGQRRSVDQLAFPLPARHRVGDQDQGRRGRLGHRRRADECLTRAARQHHDTGAALPERVGGHLLIVAQVPAVLRKADRVLLAVDVARQILCRPTDLEQHLLDATALAVVHQDGVVVDSCAEHRCDLLVSQHLLEHRAVQAHQHQTVRRALRPAAGARSGPWCRRCRPAAAAAPRTARTTPARRRPARRRGPRRARSTAPAG